MFKVGGLVCVGGFGWVGGLGWVGGCESENSAKLSFKLLNNKNRTLIINIYIFLFYL